MAQESNYDAESIQVLKGLTPVRTRPGMYIGSTDERGLHHLINEIVDNSVDEFMAGFCDEISIHIDKDQYVEVSDNGRGIPVETHSETNVSTVETVLTTLHAGGKFEEGAYQVSGGLHGVGASAVNALSEDFEVTVFRDNKTHTMSFSEGRKKTELESAPMPKENKGKTGTKIRFKADRTIFIDDETNDSTLQLSQLAEFQFQDILRKEKLIFEQLASIRPIDYTSNLMLEGEVGGDVPIRLESGTLDDSNITTDSISLEDFTASDGKYMNKNSSNGESSNANAVEAVGIMLEDFGQLQLNGTDSDSSNAGFKLKTELQLEVDELKVNPRYMALETTDIITSVGTIPLGNWTLNSISQGYQPVVPSAIITLTDAGDIALEDATDNSGGFLVLNSTSGSSTNAGSMFDLEKGTLNDVLLNSV